jgi:hypothetical protein
MPEYLQRADCNWSSKFSAPGPTRHLFNLVLEVLRIPDLRKHVGDFTAQAQPGTAVAEPACRETCLNDNGLAWKRTNSCRSWVASVVKEASGPLYPPCLRLRKGLACRALLQG